MAEIRIGTSGWVYPHWRGIFYHTDSRQREWFAYYARHFDTVEINNTFYRLPSAAAFDSWREQAPQGFLYAVKASRYLTHLKKLMDPEDPLNLFFERAERLRETLGPVLYQLPPRWRVNLDRFEGFLSALPDRYSHAVEFREASWVTEDVFRAMERFSVAHCIHDLGGLEIPLRVTSRMVYIRFHGQAAHAGNYSDEALQTWAKRIQQWYREDLDVFAFFNNDVHGHALKNAATLKELLSIE